MHRYRKDPGIGTLYPCADGEWVLLSEVKDSLEAASRLRDLAGQERDRLVDRVRDLEGIIARDCSRRGGDHIFRPRPEDGGVWKCALCDAPAPPSGPNGLGSLQRIAAMEAERAEIEEILAGDLTADLGSDMPLPDRVKQAILYAQAGNEYGVPALKLRIEELEERAALERQLHAARVALLESEIGILRRQQDESAATLREALDEQGRLRMENRRLTEAEKVEDRRILAELRNAVTVACTCGGGGPYDPHTCPACQVWHQLA